MQSERDSRNHKHNLSLDSAHDQRKYVFIKAKPKPGRKQKAKRSVNVGVLCTVNSEVESTL